MEGLTGRQKQLLELRIARFATEVVDQRLEELKGVDM